MSRKTQPSPSLAAIDAAAKIVARVATPRPLFAYFSHSFYANPANQSLDADRVDLVVIIGSAFV
jgi:hypothetical protein